MRKCPKCGSENVYDHYSASTGPIPGVEQFGCNDCGHEWEAYTK